MKKFTFIIAALMLAFMMPSLVGWGQTRENVTYTLTISGNDFNTTSYAANNNEKTSNAVCTTDNTKTYEVKWTSNQVMKNGNNMQWQKSKGYIYNSTDLGTINSVTVNSSAGSFTTYYGTSEHPTSGTTVGNGFFTTAVGGDATGTTSSVVISFTISEGGSTLLPNDLTLNANTHTFDLANGEGQTFQLTNSGVADGALSFATNNNSVATVSNTGLITAVDEGTAIITVTQEATSTYAGGSATCTVTVTDSRYEISDLTFTAACGGSGTADDGAVWTVTSDGTESVFDATSGIHYGTGSASVTYLQLATSDINGTIKKVVVNARDAQACATVSVTVGGVAFTCTGSTTATNTSADYTFTGSGSGEIIVRIDRGESKLKALYVKSVKVSYIPSTDPVIVATNPAELDYDATSGEFGYSITNPATGVSLNATSNAAWITNVAVDATNSKVTFSTSANDNTTQRTGTITLSYTGATDKVITVTQAAAPVVYTTIADIFTVATSTAANVNVTFGNWVVSGVSTNGKNVFVTDNAGNGFVIYDSDAGLGSTYAVGKTLSGTITCSLKLNQGYAQLTGVAGLTISDGGTVSTTNIAMASLAGVNTGALVSYNNLTCSVSNNKYYLTDGTTTLQVYNALYAFTELEAGKTYNITGVYQQYGNTKEILPRSASDIEEVQVQHNEYTLTVSNLSHVDLYVFDAADQTSTIISGEGSAQVYDGTSVMISVDVEMGYVIESLYVDGVDVTSQIDAADTYTFTMPTHAVTVTASAEALAGDPYELYSGALVEGDYLIVYGGKAMNNNTNSNRLQYEEVVAINNVITTENAEIVWHIAPSATDGYWTIYSTDAKGYAASTGTKSQATTIADGTDDKALWSVTVAVSKDNTYEFVNKYNQDNSVNSTLRNNGTYGFACYATGTGGPLSLYKKVEPTYTLTITGYGNNDEVKTGWNLIASPVSANPSDVENMTSGNFDLYSFNGNPTTANKEWENWKQTGDHYHFDLVPGKGYLYANRETVNLTFTGTMASSIADVVLPYDADSDLKSLYLAGNSLQDETTFYVYNDKLEKQNVNFLSINGNGDGFITTTANSFTAQAMQGFFVQSGGEGWTLSTVDLAAKSGNNELLNVKMTRDRGALIDNAIVSFDKAPQMNKFYLFDNTTRVFIPQNGEEMAVVRSEAQGEMPVNFKAAEDGQYTITVNAENVEMGYLHLIDNLTGADMDLLATPSYTFNAKTTDYASRFRLVFSANEANTENDNFAFISNGQIILTEDACDASLQVIDMLGRVVSTQQINGSQAVSIDATAGVYVLRLINGSDIKTQKIVVK